MTNYEKVSFQLEKAKEHLENSESITEKLYYSNRVKGLDEIQKKMSIETAEKTARTCEKMTIDKAVFKVISNMPIGKRFRGWELKDAVTRIYPESENCYVDTVLRSMRRMCHGMYRVIGSSRKKSI